jgi:beta-glucanase (GH16 family)
MKNKTKQIACIAILFFAVTTQAQNFVPESSSTQTLKKTKTSNANYKLVWSDEFDKEGLPNEKKWNYEVGGDGWGNNEKQFYMDKSLENSYVKGGKLHIVALKKKQENCSYTSARLTTYQRFSLQYGKVEVMAKIPAGKGNWPAIWMLPVSVQARGINHEGWPLCGEVDIMEHVGKNQDQIHVSLHSELYNHLKGTQVTHFEKIKNATTEFHKYGIEWSEKFINFYIDDKLFYEAQKGADGHATNNEGWPFDKPYYLILNLAIGGNWGADIDDSIFPNDFVIDYVRIYKKE